MQYELCVLSLLFHHVSLIMLQETEEKATELSNDNNLKPSQDTRVFNLHSIFYIERRGHDITVTV